MDLLGELKSQLELARVKLGNLNEMRDSILIQIELAEGEEDKLAQAYRALSGTTGPGVPEALAEEPRVPAPSLPPVPPVPRIPAGAVECGSCNGAMFHQSRTLQSGRVVQLWVCGDCSNERL